MVSFLSVSTLFKDADAMGCRYSYWKSYFDEDVVALSGVSRGFRKGLDLMNQAMALGDDVKYRLVVFSSFA